MKINKTLGLIAVSATVALGASAQVTTTYIPVNITGTITVGVNNSSTTATSLTTKKTAVNNKVILDLMNYWAMTVDGGTTAINTAGNKLAILWDFEGPDADLSTSPGGPDSGEIVVVDKTGALVYNPAAVNGGEHSLVFTLSEDPCVTSGSRKVIVGTTDQVDGTGFGGGNESYLDAGSLTLIDATAASPIAGTDLTSFGKVVESAIFDANGNQTKVGFTATTAGEPGEFKDISTGEDTDAIFDATISSSGGVTAGINETH